MARKQKNDKEFAKVLQEANGTKEKAFVKHMYLRNNFKMDCFTVTVKDEMVNEDKDDEGGEAFFAFV